MNRLVKLFNRNLIIYIIIVLYTISISASNNYSIEQDYVYNCMNNIIPPDIEPFNNENNTKISKIDGWYFYPALVNYAPSGMPDFDQIQDGWGTSFCGPTSVANVLWYLDSMYSDSEGAPGDDIDIFPLVKDYNAPSYPDPGPNTDDHNFNNVNDLATPWEWEYSTTEGYELIERLAVYMRTTKFGTPELRLYNAVKNWLLDVDLDKSIKVESYQNPSFNLVADAIFEGKYVVLAYYAYDDNCNNLYAHYVTVAGVNKENLLIAISDPYFNIANPTNNPQLHNNAEIVSHDIYDVNLNPHCFKGNWAIETLGIYGEVEYALIIETKTDSYLECDGNLIWSKIKPGEIVYGNFTVQNIGSLGSELIWNIDEYPKWGNWTFDPLSGDDLKPENGAITVNVKIEIPEKSNHNFSGEIKIVNIENTSNFDVIHVSITTEMRRQSAKNLILKNLLEYFLREKSLKFCKFDFLIDPI